MHCARSPDACQLPSTRLPTQKNLRLITTRADLCRHACIVRHFESRGVPADIPNLAMASRQNLNWLPRKPLEPAEVITLLRRPREWPFRPVV